MNVVTGVMNAFPNGIVTTTDFVDDDTSDGLRLLEFDMAEPVALIDYKHDKARIDFGHSSVVAQAAFASRASLPSFVVRYTDDFGHFTIYPTNSYARKLAPNGIRLTEEYFVRFLYKLRGRKIPSDVQEQVEARAAARLEANAV
jgi:hypothetical protein